MSISIVAELSLQAPDEIKAGNKVYQSPAALRLKPGY
jgi:hypothetical protein